MPDTGEDWADLYRVDPKPSGEGFKLTLLFQLHLYCEYAGAGRICNFAAANNAYVSPSGELILYSIPHDDEDWADPDFVRLAEFRHRDVNYTGTCTRGTGWAELYDDKDFNDRSIVFDWTDRDKDDFYDFNNLDGFNDKTSSVRWCAPVECNITIYENSYYGGGYVTLPGTGGVIADSDFGGFNDEVSSIRFWGADCTSGNSPPIADAGPDQFVSVGPDSTAIVALDGSASSDPDPDPLSYTWTWDGGSISGVRPTIRLPLGTTTVTLVVNDGMVNSVPDTVDIKLAVSPSFAAAFNASPTNGSAPLTVNFTDQSTGEVTSWEWDFGDGSTSTEQNPSHTYTDLGTYTVSLTVEGAGESDTETKTNYINVRESKAMPWIPLLLLED